MAGVVLDRQACGEKQVSTPDARKARTGEARNSLHRSRVVAPRSLQAALELKESDMLKWALIFAVVALIAGGLGFGGVAGAAAGIAKFLFFLFLVGFVVFLVLGFWAGRKVTGE
jgi:uncharacterized membrane protein YtjA (UPF0391 family)